MGSIMSMTLCYSMSYGSKLELSFAHRGLSCKAFHMSPLLGPLLLRSTRQKARLCRGPLAGVPTDSCKLSGHFVLVIEVSCFFRRNNVLACASVVVRPAEAESHRLGPDN